MWIRNRHVDSKVVDVLELSAAAWISRRGLKLEQIDSGQDQSLEAG